MTIGRGHTNGIYINAWRNDIELTVRYRHKQGNTVIVPGITLGVFRDLSDYMFGAGGDQPDEISILMEVIKDAIIAGAGTDISQNASYLAVQGWRSDAVGKPMRIDFGSIYLADGEEIVIDLKSPVATRIAVSTFSDSRTPHEVLTYEMVQDANSNYGQAQAIFAFAAKKGIFDYDLKYKVSDSYDSLFTNQSDLFTASRLLGQYEFIGRPDFVQVWSNSTAIPDTVSVQISGADAKTTQLLVIRKELIQAAVSANTILEAERTIQRMDKLERTEPEVAKALRHSGVVGKASDMKAELNAVKQSSTDIAI